jgi:hypothetical protein
MATRKQRKRREKEQRHEYVWEDSEGNVVDPDEAPRNGDGRKEKEKEKEKPASRLQRGGRTIQPPSWQRSTKRGLIFGPIFFLIVLLLSGGNLSITGAMLNAILLLAVFIPFSYVLDKLVYRQYQKRQAKG